MADDRIFNGHLLASFLGCPLISVKDHWFALSWVKDGKRVNHVFRLREGSSLHADKSNEKIMYGTWNEAVAAAEKKLGIDPASWVPVLGKAANGQWFPAAAAAKAVEQKLCWTGQTTSRIKFGEPGRPCTAIVSNGAWHSHACGRPAVASEKAGSEHAMGAEHGEFHRCKMHENGHNKRVANDAAWREKHDADVKERKRKKANEARCEEVLAQIRPLLAELGVHPDTLAVGTASGGKVGILLPAEVAELLTGKAVELEEMTGGGW